MLIFIVFVGQLICPRAQAIQEGQPAPCTGILWPERWTQQALLCRKVDLPQVRLQLERERESRAADTAACETRLVVRDAVIATPPVPSLATPTDNNRYPLISFGVGALIGVVLGITLSTL